MSLEITHGDLLECPCGCGVPDVLFLPFVPAYAVGCAACDVSFGRDSEDDAVQAWNGFVKCAVARAVA